MVLQKDILGAALLHMTAVVVIRFRITVAAMMVSAATVEVGVVVHIRVAVVATAVVKSAILTNFNVGYLFISRFFCIFAEKDKNG